MMAALDALKAEHAVTRFHLVGQSGGGHTVAALLQMRKDIGCAVMTSGVMSDKTAIRDRGLPVTARISERLRPDRPCGGNARPPGPADRGHVGSRRPFVSFRSQREFVERVRNAGLPILHISAAADDEDFHALEAEGRRLASDCAKGVDDQTLISRYQTKPVGPAPLIRSALRLRAGRIIRTRRDNASAGHAGREITMNTAAKSTNFIKGATGDWEVVIGMEVHAQVSSNAKLFSGASTEFGGAPNSHVSLVDAAMPGMLPVINAECVRQAVRTGLGLKARINLKSVFDRKNYFYPDLPQGYQISQYKSPIVGEGEVVVDLPRARASRSASSGCISSRMPASRCTTSIRAMSYVDLNRSGVALMEIVSKPDIRSSEEAKAYVAKLRSILRYLGTCDGDMEKGSLRADVNVSVRKPGAPLGTRCEIKNVNSIRFIGAGDRARGAPPDRNHRGRRHDRSGDAAVRSRQGRDALDALEGGGARLSLFPRSGPAAARADAGRGRRAEGAAAGTAG